MTDLPTSSGGRFELGLGLGRPSAFGDAERLGVRLERTGQLDRLRAVLAAVRELPAQQRPPVLIAAGGPRMLRLAGAEADIVTLGLLSIATVAELAEAARTVRGGGGRPPAAGTGLEPGAGRHQLPHRRPAPGRGAGPGDREAGRPLTA
jgi:alkanesulfonate monooxygenase SsuD/methylene tetrahydromethanopterin reductase-like flavin-dependent oxidoreductase (luciferase family)